MVERPHERPHALQAHASSRRLQPGHDTACGRNSDTAPGVAPQGGEGKVCGEYRPGASAGPPHRAVRRLRVRHGGGTHPEGAGIARAHSDDDGPRAAKLTNHLRVRLGTIVGEEVEPRRAYRRGGVDDVLDRDRDPRERPRCDAASPPTIRASGFPPGAVGGHVAQGAQPGIQALDSLERPIRDLDRADLAALQSGGGRGQIQRCTAAHELVRPSFSPRGVTPACNLRGTARSGRSSRRFRSLRCR